MPDLFPECAAVDDPWLLAWVGGPWHASLVEAARALGVSTWRIMTVHILLNVASPILVQATFIFAYAVLAEAGVAANTMRGRAIAAQVAQLDEHVGHEGSWESVSGRG